MSVNTCEEGLQGGEDWWARSLTRHSRNGREGLVGKKSNNTKSGNGLTIKTEHTQ